MASKDFKKYDSQMKTDLKNGVDPKLAGSTAAKKQIAAIRNAAAGKKETPKDAGTRKAANDVAKAYRSVADRQSANKRKGIKQSEFGAAFKNARQSGVKEFTFKGKKYTTKVK